MHKGVGLGARQLVGKVVHAQRMLRVNAVGGVEGKESGEEAEGAIGSAAHELLEAALPL